MMHGDGGAAVLARKGMLADPGDHFVGRFEVERKFRTEDLSAFRDRLTTLGGVAFTLGNRETDIYFDWPDGRLRQNSQQMVLRRMEPSGRVLWISKGPGADKCVAMDLDDFDKVLALLLSIGFEETGRLAKDRDIYFLDAFHITLDRVPPLGTFVEIAVMTDDEGSLVAWEARVDAMAAKLELPAADRQVRSYREMLAENR